MSKTGFAAGIKYLFWPAWDKFKKKSLLSDMNVVNHFNINTNENCENFETELAVKQIQEATFNIPLFYTTNILFWK